MTSHALLLLLASFVKMCIDLGHMMLTNSLE